MDHADVIEEKEALLRGDAPRCSLERVSMDLSHVAERRALFDDLRRLG